MRRLLIIADDLTGALDAASPFCGAPGGVGARGLAQACAAWMGVPVTPAITDLPAPLAIAAGSTDPITLAQVAHIRNTRLPCRYVTAPSGQAPVPPGGPWSGLTLIQATKGETPRPRQDVSRDFAATTEAWLEGVRSILVTGGATAEAVMDGLGLDILSLRGEALPGMPVCIANGKVIITKSGGFGTQETFTRLAERMQ